ncbi:hypothetical protein DPMN_190921 [Dreissena polymorpha]|uniref:Uncharacterized protein n=1 Tax=Dreissena polymorpha TaxID=45954 RepID=A0A9D4BE34_DREPO|nr:hypothetical protein DPMN_190921 [Dreissena polymorpha]
MRYRGAQTDRPTYQQTNRPTSSNTIYPLFFDGGWHQKATNSQFTSEASSQLVNTINIYYSETNWSTDRQTDRQTDRPTYQQTNRPTSSNTIYPLFFDGGWHHKATNNRENVSSAYSSLIIPH